MAIDVADPTRPTGIGPEQAQRMAREAQDILDALVAAMALVEAHERLTQAMEVEKRYIVSPLGDKVRAAIQRAHELTGWLAQLGRGS